MSMNLSKPVLANEQNTPRQNFPRAAFVVAKQVHCNMWIRIKVQIVFVHI